MKTAAGVALTLILAGCAGPEPVPQGHIPDAGKGNIAQEPRGMLVVHAQSDFPGGRYGLETGEPHVASYNVRTEDGTVLRSDVQDSVTLPPGRYLVEVPHATEHARWFWVTIASNEVTEVDATKIPADAR